MGRSRWRKTELDVVATSVGNVCVWGYFDVLCGFSASGIGGTVTPLASDKRVIACSSC